MPYNRRRKRSHRTAVSLHYWLEAVARRENVAALVLADVQGQLVAANRRGKELEELATIAPTLATRDEENRTWADQEQLPVFFSRMRVKRSAYYLCAVGDQARCRRSLMKADEGVRRIINADQESRPSVIQ